MTAHNVPAVLLEWAIRTTRCERVERCSVRSLTGGAVSDQVEQITLHLAGCPAEGERTVVMVRKLASAHEIAGLRAAQAIRPAATAIPELIAAGKDEDGPWLVTPCFVDRPCRNGPRPSPRTCSSRWHACKRP